MSRNYQGLLCAEHGTGVISGWGTAFDVEIGGQRALHEIDICLRSSIVDEVHCDVFLKNKCEVS